MDLKRHVRKDTLISTSLTPIDLIPLPHTDLRHSSSPLFYVEVPVSGPCTLMLTSLIPSQIVGRKRGTVMDGRKETFKEETGDGM